jgi:nucleotide-binding universal stress UspA family protein
VAADSILTQREEYIIMGKILCATRGGEASYRTQDAVIALALEGGDSLVFLYVVDTDFLGFTERAVRPDVVATEMEHMGEFLLAMACEKANAQGVETDYCVKRGKLDVALKEAAVERGVSLVALGRPAGEESRFQIAGLEKLAAEIAQETGIEARII